MGPVCGGTPRAGWGMSRGEWHRPRVTGTAPRVMVAALGASPAVMGSAFSATASLRGLWWPRSGHPPAVAAGHALGHPPLGAGDRARGTSRRGLGMRSGHHPRGLQGSCPGTLGASSWGFCSCLGHRPRVQGDLFPPCTPTPSTAPFPHQRGRGCSGVPGAAPASAALPEHASYAATLRLAALAAGQGTAGPYKSWVRALSLPPRHAGCSDTSEPLPSPWLRNAHKHPRPGGTT